MKKYDLTICWSLSNFCPLDCEYCYIYKETRHNKNNVKSIDIQKAIKTIEKFKTNNINILLSGGEPFFVDNIIELSKKLTEKYNISIASNLISNKIEEFANNINPKKIDYILTSIHLEELDKKGLFEKFIKNYKLLEKKGFNLTPEIVGHPKVLKIFDKYKKILTKHNINYLIRPFMGLYENKKYPESYSIEIKNKFNLTPEIKLKTIKNYVCHAGNSFIFIRPDGIAINCWQMGIKLGSIYDNINLREINIVCPYNYCSCPYDKLYNNNKLNNYPKEKYFKLFTEHNPKYKKIIFLRYYNKAIMPNIFKSSYLTFEK